MGRLNLAVAAGILSLSAIPALAQSTSTVSLHLFGADPVHYVASLVSVGPTATTYFVECPTDDPDLDASDCAFIGGVELVEGPSTLSAHFGGSSYPWTQDVDCTVDNGKSAECHVLLTETVSGSSTVQDKTVTTTSYAAWAVDVTITAGLEDAASGASATTGAAETTAASATTGAAQSTGTPSQSSGASSQSTGTSSQSTGGVPRATGNAIVAGVAAIFGGVLMF